MKKTYREKALEKIIVDIFWMAKRYAHGRHTYAPGIVREAYYSLKKCGIEIKGDDVVIELPKEGEIKGMTFRSDYLDDIN